MKLIDNDLMKGWEFRVFDRRFMGKKILQIYHDDDIKGSINLNEDELKIWEELANVCGIPFDKRTDKGTG